MFHVRDENIIVIHIHEMDHILTDECNRMNESTPNSLLFITFNGPDVRSFPTQKKKRFGLMWNTADDVPTTSLIQNALIRNTINSKKN